MTRDSPGNELALGGWDGHNGIERDREMPGDRRVKGVEERSRTTGGFRALEEGTSEPPGFSPVEHMEKALRRDIGFR
jgi:hypothetical protein